MPRDAGTIVSGTAIALAICAYQEPSNADGVNGDAADTSTPGAGAVYIFE